MVFRQLIGRDPDVIAGEIDVLPAKRGEMGEEVIGNVLDLAHGGDRAVQIAGIPQDNRRDEEVQTGSPMLLIFVSAGANFPEPMNEDSPRQAVV